VHDAAEQELGQAREHGHAGDERQATLPGRQDADRKVHTRERGGHEVAGAEVARIQAEQDRADAEHQHADRHQVLSGLVRRLGRVEHQQGKKHADGRGDENMLERGHPQHERGRAVVEAVDQLGGLDRQAGLPDRGDVAAAPPQLIQSCCNGHYPTLALWL
jgi:hypothetical protein